MEFATGDGMRIGQSDINTDYSEECKFAPNLPNHISRRGCYFDCSPKKEFQATWEKDFLSGNENWIKFQGLWGQQSKIEGEHGPQGPKWDGDKVRMRWGRQELQDGTTNPNPYLEWLFVLLLDLAKNEDQPTYIRKKAMEYLAKK